MINTVLHNKPEPEEVLFERIKIQIRRLELNKHLSIDAIINKNTWTIDPHQRPLLNLLQHDIESLLSVNPKHRIGLLAAGAVYMYLDQDVLALRALNTQLELSPADMLAHKLRIRVYCKLNRLDLAAAGFERWLFLALPSDRLDLLRLRIKLNMKLNRPALEIADLTTVLHSTDALMTSERLSMLIRRGKLWYELEQWREAARDLTDASTYVKSHEREELYYLLSSIHMKQDNFTEALSFLNSHVCNTRHTPERLFNTLVRLHQVQGHTLVGSHLPGHYYQKSLKLRSQLYEKQGKKEEALFDAYVADALVPFTQTPEIPSLQSLARWSFFKKPSLVARPQHDSYRLRHALDAAAINPRTLRFMAKRFNPAYDETATTLFDQLDSMDKSTILA